MKEQNKIIKIALIIIFVLAIVLILKMTGVIKPTAKKIANTSKDVISENQTFSNNIENNLIVNHENMEKSFDEERSEVMQELDSQTRKMNKILRISMGVMIAINLLMIIVNIGEGKLYKKLEMPDWTVVFTYIYPFITIVSNIAFGGVNGFLGFIISIITITICCYYFKAVGMSTFWPLFPLCTGIFLIFFGAFLRSIILLVLLVLLVLLISFVAFIVAYMVSNYKLGEAFGKSTVFKVGLVILPFIFRPILGFQRD